LILGTERLATYEKNLSGSQRPSRVSLVILRLVSVLLISFSALFFGAFTVSAQAHGMHASSVSEPTTLTNSTDASDIVASINNAADVVVKGCGINCCSMTGCGYVPQRLEEVFLPEISVSMRPVFSTLPWVKNPLDSLQRPPRAFA
jgi:hypothetical protein